MATPYYTSLEALPPHLPLHPLAEVVNGVEPRAVASPKLLRRNNASFLDAEELYAQAGSTAASFLMPVDDVAPAQRQQLQAAPQAAVSDSTEDDNMDDDLYCKRQRCGSPYCSGDESSPEMYCLVMVRPRCGSDAVTAQQLLLPESSGSDGTTALTRLCHQPDGGDLEMEQEDEDEECNGGHEAQQQFLHQERAAQEEEEERQQQQDEEERDAAPLLLATPQPPGSNRITAAGHPAAAQMQGGPRPPGFFHHKSGGPCDHCGVKESPQWRRGPADKPMLCNACGTRYRRTSQLLPLHGAAAAAARAAAAASAIAPGGSCTAVATARKRSLLEEDLPTPEPAAAPSSTSGGHHFGTRSKQRSLASHA